MRYIFKKSVNNYTIQSMQLILHYNLNSMAYPFSTLTSIVMSPRVCVLLQVLSVTLCAQNLIRPTLTPYISFGDDTFSNL